MKKTPKTKDIAGLVKPGVRKLTAYHVDETPVRIKLDAMENPFPLPAELRQEIAAAVREARSTSIPIRRQGRSRRRLRPSGAWSRSG